MSDTIPSTNMNMPVPIVGVESGPLWALDVNACLAILDAHDHTPGYGAPITPAALNISSDLTFMSNNATNLRSTRFTSQVAVLSLPSDLDSLYVVDKDLYYNDGLGNNIRITQSGGVAGSPGSIANLTSPASASYVALSSTFVWQSAANTPANMDAASYIFRNLVANSFGLTLQPPAAMGANYTLTLPSLPTSQKIMTLDAAGNMSAPWSFDSSTIEVSSNVVQVKNFGIAAAQLASNSVTTAKILNANVTRPKLEAVGNQLSLDSGGFSGTSPTFVSVPNMGVSITTSGRPIIMGLIPDDSGSASLMRAGSVSNSATAKLRIVSNSVEIAQYDIDIFANGASSVTTSQPVSSISLIYAAPAGTYALEFQYKVTGSTTFNLENTRFFAYEL